MPYDKILAERVRAALNPYPEMVEKVMFGGVGYMLHGNLACGVQGEDLIVRIGEAEDQAALKLSFVRSFMPVPGRPMAGWILVAPAGTGSEQELAEWVNKGVQFAATLPEKK